MLVWVVLVADGRHLGGDSMLLLLLLNGVVSLVGRRQNYQLTHPTSRMVLRMNVFGLVVLSDEAV